MQLDEPSRECQEMLRIRDELIQDEIDLLSQSDTMVSTEYELAMKVMEGRKRDVDTMELQVCTGIT